MKSYGKRNAITGDTCFGTECSNTINRKGLVHGAVNNSCRVLSVREALYIKIGHKKRHMDVGGWEVVACDVSPYVAMVKIDNL